MMKRMKRTSTRWVIPDWMPLEQVEAQLEAQTETLDALAQALRRNGGRLNCVEVVWWIKRARRVGATYRSVAALTDRMGERIRQLLHEFPWCDVQESADQTAPPTT